MPLPSDVTPKYLQSCHPTLRKVWGIIASRAPDNIQSRVSELTSEISLSGGKCIFRDRDGELLYETPDPPPPISQKAVARDLRIEGLEQKVAKSRELGLSNAAAVEEIHRCIQEVAEVVGQIGARTCDLEEHFETNLESNLAAVHDVQQALSSRLKTVESTTKGLQARVDREGRGLFFRGTWQPAIDYESGAVVTHGKRAYVAIKSLRSGGEAPGRDGGGWTPMFDSTQIPRSLENVAEEVAVVVRGLVNPLQDRLASLENEIALLKK